MQSTNKDWTPFYSKWRHGGWYVSNVRYPSGACGCVSNNYPDKKWRIVCDPRRNNLGEPGDFTFRSRGDAARAELALVNALHAQQTSEEASKEKKHPDEGLTIEQLQEKHGGERGCWGQHPDFPLTDWQSEVADDNTRLGYWPWVEEQIAQYEPPEEDDDDSADDD